MTMNFWTMVRTATGGGLMALLLAAQAFGQAATPPAPKPDAKADTKDAKEAAKDTKDAAKDTAKDTKDAAKDTAKDAKDTAKDTKGDVKDTAKDARNEAKDTAKDARDTAKDARDTAKDSAKDAKDTAKDTRDDVKDRAKDTAKDARDTAKDTARDARDRASDSRDRDSRDNRDRDSRDTRDRDTRDTRDARDRDTRDSRDTRDARDRDTRDSRDARDRDRDTRDRDVTRDRDTRDRDVTRDRDSRSDARASSRTSFRANDVRAADIGLWFDGSARDGLVISDVSTSGAIAKLGFQEGDRIVSVNGQRVTRERDFVEYLFADDVRDERVKVIVLRDDKEQVVYVEPNVLVEDYRYVDNDPVEHFGVVLDDRYDDRIVVWKVIPQSPAYYAGIRAGDVFTTFRGQNLATRDDFVRVVRDVDAGEVPVQVKRNDRMRDFRVEVPEFQARSERRTALRPNADVERPNERRETRIEERRDDRRGVDTPRVTPAPAPAPLPAPAPAPGRPRVLPRR